MSKAVLLVNLGSPDSPSVPDVRRYLNEFLMDPRVIDVAWPLRRLIVGMILINRPKASGHAYSTIWTKEGSPLIVISKHVQAELQKRVSVPVELAMRYQNPSIGSAVKKLAGQGVTQLLMIPLFPHYAMASYESAVERVKEMVAKHAPKMALIVQPPFYDSPDFIRAMVAVADEYLKAGYDHLLFSYHGVPERQVKKTDPSGQHCLLAKDCCSVPHEAHKYCYRHQCYRTTEEFVKLAGIPVGKYSVSFQSRLGRDPWLQPFTDHIIPKLAANGVKKLLIISPAFVSDCLETLEELRIRGRDNFLKAGGKEFAQIPCVNEHPLWIAALEKMVNNSLGK